VHDSERLRREHRVLARLAIALVGEGVTVTRVVPESFDRDGAHAGERRIARVRRNRAGNAGWWHLRSARQAAEAVADALEKSPPDVVHVVGRAAWRLGVHLGEELDRPVTIDAWALDLVQPATALARHAGPDAFLAATRPLADRLRLAIAAERVIECPWGVACRTELPPRAPLQSEPMVTIVGRCRDLAAYAAALEGVRRVLDGQRDLRVVLELQEPGGHDVWRMIRGLDLLGHVSCISDAESLIDLVLDSDALLVPEASGTVRGLLLEAMEAGVPIIAAADPLLESLVDDANASIVAPPVAEEWARRIHRLFAHPEEAAGLAAAARRTVLGRCRSSQWAGRLVEIFEKLGAAPALSFADGAA
jgi:glycosyltransferase involved in cell wall biosynthesis